MSSIQSQYKIKDMHLVLCVIHLLFTDASSDMVSMEGWLDKPYLNMITIYGGDRDFDFTIKNTSGNTVIIMDRPPQSPDRNRGQQSGIISKTSKELWVPFKKLENYFWRLLKKNRSSPKRVQAKHKACWIENCFEMPQQQRWLKII